MQQDMKERDSFWGRHPCLLTNIIGLAAAIICCATPLRSITGVIGMVMMISGGVVFPYLFIMNVVSFIVVLKNKILAGTVLSLLGGALGSLLAQTFVQSDSKSFKVISTACMWIFICLIASGLVYINNDFRLFM